MTGEREGMNGMGGVVDRLAQWGWAGSFWVARA